jgi:pimeloyl-ACP methyl ester carboxylesterase
VVGHSFGGQIALDFALLAPQRVQALTLICTRDTPFPAFAGAAARLRHGSPVDVAAALRRWFTAPELSAGSRRHLRAAAPAASRPGRMGGRAGCWIDREVP